MGCYGKGVHQEAFSSAHQREGVAVELPIVIERVAGRALELCDLEQQLRELGLRDLVPNEQHDRGTREVVALDEQPQTAQNLEWIAGAWVIEPASADRFFDGEHHRVASRPSLPPSTGTLSTEGKSGGSNARNSCASSSSVRSETSCPTTLPAGVTPKSTRPPGPLANAHSVRQARSFSAVDFLNSTVSDSREAAQAVT